jgi:RNA polymerase sigma-70 factor (ECF subfamily)
VPAPEPHPDHADALAERLDDQQRMRTILEALSRLPLPDQEVVALVSWTGLSYEEAAAALGVPVGTVRSRLSRARTRLRELAERSGHGSGEALASAAVERTEEER